MATKYDVRRVADLNTGNSVYNLFGVGGTAPANSTTNIDWTVGQDRWVSGGICFAKGGQWGDKITVQVLTPADAVIREFMTNFFVRDDSQFQCRVDIPYLALIPDGFKIRIKYTNTSLLATVKVAINFFMHVPLDIFEAEGYDP